MKAIRTMRKVLWSLVCVVIAFVVSSPCDAEWAIAYGGSELEWAHSIQETSDGGYIVTGYTGSFGAGGIHFWVLKLNTDGSVVWQKTYGGSGSYFDFSIQETSDGGYILAGVTESFGAGSHDFWVSKLNTDGSVAWQKTYGGSYWDDASSIQETSDGGYILAGVTGSFGAGDGDFWVLKLNTDGSVAWQKTYGGSGSDGASSIQETSDGGYIVAGCTHSFGAGAGDFWVLRLNTDGSVAWQKTYGGSLHDYVASIRETSDGGYIMAGDTRSFGAGRSDFWVLKLNADGSVAWQKAYGGSDLDSDCSIREASDGGYIVAGFTGSFGAGYWDFWVLKLNTDGSVAWQKTYGGSSPEYPRSIQETSDGGYVVAGYTFSFGAGRSDFWVLKLNSSGEIPDCGIVGDSDAVVNDTPATPGDTGVQPQDSSAVVADTDVTPQDSSAVVTVVCMSIGQPPVADANGPYTGNEGSPVTFDGSDSYDPDGTIVSYEWDLDGDGQYDDATGVSPSMTWDDDYSGDIGLKVTDDAGLTGTDATTVTISNVPPSVGDIAASSDPVRVDTETTASASFTDPGAKDTHTAKWDWGDGSTSDGAVNESNGSGTASGKHTYSTPGLYTITLTVTDDDGGSDQSIFQYVVVYDPEGGFVTGGGWIDSLGGFYIPDRALTGKANFGFSSKYKKRADVPTGETEFQFRKADLNFHSTSYEWLVVVGPRAIFKGEGTINREGNYGFLLSAIDANLTPATEVDLFRMKIWDMDNGAVVYDNQMGDADDADPISEIGGGSIVIHGSEHELAAPALQPSLPETSCLLSAYPIPNNPDVWMPYQLGTDSDVVIRIHDAAGRLVRTLELGHRPAGYYVSKDKAAYWDGRNEAGEEVSSGVYFYTLEAGSYRASKKLVIAR